MSSGVSDDPQKKTGRQLDVVRVFNNNLFFFSLLDDVATVAFKLYRLFSGEDYPGLQIDVRVSKEEASEEEESVTLERLGMLKANTKTSSTGLRSRGYPNTKLAAIESIALLEDLIFLIGTLWVLDGEPVRHLDEYATIIVKGAVKKIKESVFLVEWITDISKYFGDPNQLNALVNFIELLDADTFVLVPTKENREFPAIIGNLLKFKTILSAILLELTRHTSVARLASQGIEDSAEATDYLDAVKEVGAFYKGQKGKNTTPSYRLEMQRAFISGVYFKEYPKERFSSVSKSGVSVPGAFSSFFDITGGVLSAQTRQDQYPYTRPSPLPLPPFTSTPPTVPDVSSPQQQPSLASSSTPPTAKIQTVTPTLPAARPSPPQAKPEPKPSPTPPQQPTSQIPKKIQPVAGPQPAPTQISLVTTTVQPAPPATPPPSQKPPSSAPPKTPPVATTPPPAQPAPPASSSTFSATRPPPSLPSPQQPDSQKPPSLTPPPAAQQPSPQTTPKPEPSPQKPLSLVPDVTAKECDPIEYMVAMAKRYTDVIFNTDVVFVLVFAGFVVEFELYSRMKMKWTLADSRVRELTNPIISEIKTSHAALTDGHSLLRMTSMRLFGELLKDTHLDGDMLETLLSEHSSSNPKSFSLFDKWTDAMKSDMVNTRTLCGFTTSPKPEFKRLGSYMFLLRSVVFAAAVISRFIARFKSNDDWSWYNEKAISNRYTKSTDEFISNALAKYSGRPAASFKLTFNPIE